MKSREWVCVGWMTLLVLVACKKPPTGREEGVAPALSEVSEPATTSTPAADGQDASALETQRCRAALDLAKTDHPNIAVASAPLPDSEWSFDLNMDGASDCLLTHGETMRNSEYLLYVMDSSGPRFVGSVRANALVGSPYCVPEKVTNGFCELQAGELMLHGETQTTTYRFDGERYTSYGPSELSPPRQKFTPQ